MRLAVLLLLICSMANAQETNVEFLGNAYDLNTGELIYQEVHLLTLSEDHKPIRELVTYVSADGTTLGQKELDYQSLLAPNYTVNYRQGNKQESVTISGDFIDVSARKIKSLPSPTDLYAIDAGFHYLILDQFDTLMSGNTVFFDFLSAGRASFFEMKIKPEKSGNRLFLELSLSNFFLSTLVNSIELVYDIDSRQLLQYKGITNIADSKGRLVTADIQYSYPTNMHFPKLANNDTFDQ